MRRFLTLIPVLLVAVLLSLTVHSQAILRTDRSFYFPGDNILLEAWIVGKPVPDKVSETVYLVGSNNQLYKTFQLNIINGHGSALSPISDLVKEGYYDIVVPIGSSQTLRETIYIGQNPPIETDDNSQTGTISSQGSQLVCGCASVFKLKSKPNQRYFLTSMDSVFTDSISTDQWGIGTFLYKPNYKQTTLSFLLWNETDTITIVPETSPKKFGYCISSSINEFKGYVEVRIAKNDSLQNGRILDVKFTNHGKTFEAQPDLSTNPYALIRYSFKDLYPGMAALRITDNESEETLYHQSLIVPSDRQEIKLSISDAAPRSQVTLRIKNSSNTAIKGSIKVIPMNMTRTDQHSSSLLVKTLLPESIAQSNPGVVSALIRKDYDLANRYLIGIDPQPLHPGTFNFNNFPMSNFKFEREIRDSVLLVLYSPPHNLITESYVKSREFDYKMYFDFRDSLQFFYQVFQEDDPLDNKIKLNTKTPEFVGSERPLLSGEHKESYEKLSKINQYYPSPRKRDQELRGFQLPIDFERDLTEFYKFETMEEAVTELMPGLAVRRRKGEKVIRVFDDEYREFLDGGDPTFIINDIPVFDSKTVFTLDSKKLFYFGIANHQKTLNAYGRLGKYGVVKLRTTEDIQSSINPNKVTLIGQLPYKSSTVAFEPPTNNWPIYNPLIYYKNKVEINPYQSEQVEWLHNDISGEFLVIFEGVDSDGLPVYSTQTYNISL
ncbi:MAG: hypothetical protein RIC35_21695 [Marinoscillum sp.]